mmetsp:Transcript_18678/g.37793  ORF Transcript_18678/g.37793 Transcript_18678/m.37793 type:complete len:260 (+) Transcript_18678:776-1555(+)
MAFSLLLGERRNHPRVPEACCKTNLLAVVETDLQLRSLYACKILSSDSVGFFLKNAEPSLLSLLSSHLHSLLSAFVSALASLRIEVLSRRAVSSPCRLVPLHTAGALRQAGCMIIVVVVVPVRVSSIVVRRHFGVPHPSGGSLHVPSLSLSLGRQGLAVSLPHGQLRVEILKLSELLPDFLQVRGRLSQGELRLLSVQLLFSLPLVSLLHLHLLWRSEPRPGSCCKCVCVLFVFFQKAPPRLVTLTPAGSSRYVRLTFL